MKKLLLLSVLYAILLLPLLAARDPHPMRGVKKAMLMMVLYNLWYAFAVLNIWTQMKD